MKNYNMVLAAILLSINLNAQTTIKQNNIQKSVFENPIQSIEVIDKKKVFLKQSIITLKQILKAKNTPSNLSRNLTKKIL
jgi:phosphoribosyl-dephospho-CoA transferase